MWGGRPKAHAVTRLYGSLFVCLFQRRTLCGADITGSMLWHSLTRGAELSPSFTPGLGTQKLPIRFDTDTCSRVQSDGKWHLPLYLAWKRRNSPYVLTRTPVHVYRVMEGKMAPSFIPGLGMQTPRPPPIPDVLTQTPVHVYSVMEKWRFLSYLALRTQNTPHSKACRSTSTS